MIQPNDALGNIFRGVRSKQSELDPKSISMIFDKLWEEGWDFIQFDQIIHTLKTNMYSVLFLFVWFWTSTVLMTHPDHWTVLISTSSGYENYRHQADVCHAYQTTSKRGILRSHIAGQKNS